MPRLPIKLYPLYYLNHFLARGMTVKYGNMRFWHIKKIRKCFNQSSVCFAINGFFPDFDDECFFSKQIFHPFDRFFSASWFDVNSYFHYCFAHFTPAYTNGVAKMLIQHRNTQYGRMTPHINA